jgi:hypothetical protein
MEQQLTFFDDNSELAFLKREIISLKNSHDNMRRALFARHNELEKLYEELKEKSYQEQKSFGELCLKN